jgi:hypothetical protein
VLRFTDGSPTPRAPLRARDCFGALPSPQRGGGSSMQRLLCRRHPVRQPQDGHWPRKFFCCSPHPSFLSSEHWLRRVHGRCLGISGRGRQSRQRVQPAVSPQFRRAHVGFSSIGDAPIYRPQQLAPRGLSGGPTHPASQLLCLPEQLLPSALLRDRPALCCGPPPPLAIDLIDDTNSPVNQRFQHRDENLRVGAGRQRRQGGHQVEQETSAHTRGF